jgi:sugar phosphate isomerase/epimerase
MWGSSITFEDDPLERATGIMAELGFTRVEMWKPHLRRCRTPALRQAFANYAGTLGIRMGGLNVVGEDYFRPFGSDDEWQQTLQGLRNDVDYALSLGSNEVLVWEGVRPKHLTDQQCKEQLLPRLVDLFREAISYAAPSGVRFLTEPHPFTVGMADDFLIALCDSLPAESFGVVFDFCHYGVGRPNDYVEAVRRLRHRICHIHFSDSDQKSSELHFAPGDGKMDLPSLLVAFQEIGYRGTLALDLYGNPTPITAARQSRAAVKKACNFLQIGQSGKS